MEINKKAYNFKRLYVFSLLLIGIKSNYLIYTKGMEKVFKIMKKELNKNVDKKIVVWCIGSKEIIGDSLGPCVGERLIRNNKNKNVVIKGCLREPVHYLNIQEEIINLRKKYSNIYSIVVDSTLYSKAYIGKVVLAKNETILGSALDKRKYSIGNLSIKGIVGEDYKNPLKNIKILEKVPEKLILKMSFNIANQILKVVN